MTPRRSTNPSSPGPPSSPSPRTPPTPSSRRCSGVRSPACRGCSDTGRRTPSTRWSGTGRRGTPGSAPRRPASTTCSTWCRPGSPGCSPIAAAPIAGRTPAEALRVWRRDRNDHPSPNAGQCESAMAGALGRAARRPQRLLRTIRDPAVPRRRAATDRRPPAPRRPALRGGRSRRRRPGRGRGRPEGRCPGRMRGAAGRSWPEAARRPGRLQPGSSSCRRHDTGRAVCVSGGCSSRGPRRTRARACSPPASAAGCTAAG